MMHRRIAYAGLLAVALYSGAVVAMEPEECKSAPAECSVDQVTNALAGMRVGAAGGSVRSLEEEECIAALKRFDQLLQKAAADANSACDLFKKSALFQAYRCNALEENVAAQVENLRDFYVKARQGVTQLGALQQTFVKVWKGAGRETPGALLELKAAMDESDSLVVAVHASLSFIAEEARRLSALEISGVLSEAARSGGATTEVKKRRRGAQEC